MLDDLFHHMVHFFDWCNHVRRASISSQSKIRVEGRLFTQLFVHTLVSLPIAITIVEGSVLEEIFKAHRIIDSRAVISILVTDLLEGVHSLDAARYHLWDCADSEIPALLNHLTKLLLYIFAPGSDLCRNFVVECIDFFPWTLKEVCEDIFSVCICLTEMLSVLILAFVLHLSQQMFLIFA